MAALTRGCRRLAGGDESGDPGSGFVAGPNQSKEHPIGEGGMRLSSEIEMWQVTELMPS